MKIYKVNNTFFDSQSEAGKYADKVGAFLIRAYIPENPEYQEGAKLLLEEYRKSLRAENISMSELANLQELASYIEPGDVELLEAAGVPEFPGDSDIEVITLPDGTKTAFLSD